MFPGSNNYFFLLFLFFFGGGRAFGFLVIGNIQILGFELFTFSIENELESLHVKFSQHLSPGFLVPSGDDILGFW